MQWAAERPKKSKFRLTLCVVEAPARSVATAVGLIEKLRARHRRAWCSSSGRKDAHLPRRARGLDTAATTHYLTLGSFGSSRFVRSAQEEGFIVLCSVLKTKCCRGLGTPCVDAS